MVSVSRLATELPEILASWDGGEAVNLSAISDVPFRGNSIPPPQLTLTLPLAPAFVSRFPLHHLTIIPRGPLTPWSPIYTHHPCRYNGSIGSPAAAAAHRQIWLVCIPPIHPRHHHRYHLRGSDVPLTPAAPNPPFVYSAHRYKSPTCTSVSGALLAALLAEGAVQQPNRLNSAQTLAVRAGQVCIIVHYSRFSY